MAAPFWQIDPGDWSYVRDSLAKTTAAKRNPFGPGEVMILSQEKGVRVRAWVDDEGIKPAGGYASYDEIPRPHREPIIDWKGWSARRCVAPIILSARTLGTPDVEDHYRNLESLGRSKARSGSPPALTLNGTVVPDEVYGKFWLLENIEHGDTRRNAKGNRTLLRLTLYLVERHGGDTVVLTNTRPAKADREHHVRRGENLAEIATARLGSTMRWREIFDLNKGVLKKQHVTGPRKNIRAGTVLRLPVDPLP